MCELLLISARAHLRELLVAAAAAVAGMLAMLAMIAGVLDELEAVAGMPAELEAVAGMLAVAGMVAELEVVAGMPAELEAVAGMLAVVDTLAELEAVAGMPAKLAQLQTRSSAPSTLAACGHAGLAPRAAGAKLFEQQAGRLHEDYVHTALSHLSASTDQLRASGSVRPYRSVRGPPAAAVACICGGL